MELANMTAKRLHEWVIKLQWAISTKNTADEQNKPLYNKWLVEALNEITARRERREKYLQEVKRNEQNQNTARSIY